MHSEDDRRDSSGSTVERMLEEMSYQTDLLARMLAESRRANCQLEQIARETCEVRNELHRQTALQNCLLKLQKEMDIPMEVLASLPSPDEIRAKAEQAALRARDAEQSRDRKGAESYRMRDA